MANGNDDNNGLGLPPLNRGRSAPLPGFDDDRGVNPTEEDLKIQSILANEDYAGARLEIYRKDEVGKWGFLSTGPISEWSGDSKRAIAQEYGGGEYRARVRTSDGVMGQSFKFDIDKAVKPKAAAPAETANPLDMFKQLKAMTGDSMPLMMQMMQQQSASQMAFMQMMMTQQAKSQETLMTVLMRPQAPASSGNDRIMELLLTKALAPQPVAPALDLDKMISFAGQMAKLTRGGSGADEDAPAKDEPDIFMTILQSLPSIIKTFTSIRLPAPMQSEHAPAAQSVIQNAPTASPAQPGPVQEVETVASPASVAGAADAAGANKQALAQFLPQLVALAAEGQDYKGTAAMIDSVMDDAQFDGIVSLLNLPDWLAILSDAHPPVMQHSNWFIDLRRELLDIAADTPIEVDSSPGTGH